MQESQKDHHKGLAKALMAGVVANLLVAISKFIAFFFTGSSAMLAEGFHSIADSSNQALLGLGLKRASKKATRAHPFGYGQERYFWAFMVALLVFLMGAVFAIYEGIHKLAAPTPVEKPLWSLGALTFAFAFEFFALKVAWGEFKVWRKDNPGTLFESLRKTKDPTLPTILFEDSAALLGLVVAAFGVIMTWATGDPVYDAIASIVIGVLLLFVACFLAIESHSLLMGESASPQAEAKIRQQVEDDDAVDKLVELMTLHRAHEEIMVAITVEFADNLKTGGIEDAVMRIEANIRDVLPDAVHIFIEAGRWRRTSSDDQ